METSFGGATPPAAQRHDIRFEGSGGEYFKIWIVNFALTILTLGIFSAWAKVRSKRYFYGNTFIAGHSFDYHGKPIRILIGRLIALGLLLFYMITTAIVPAAAAFWVLIFLFAAPWLIVSSFRFTARNTSYRNLRFDFHGTTWGAIKAFLLWPLLAVVTLGTTTPLAHRARYYYQINSHSFGGKNFETVIPGGQMYKIYLIALAMIIGVACLIGVLLTLAGIDFTSFATADGTPPEPTPALIGALLLSFIAYGAGFLFVSAFIGAMTFNLAVSRTKLGDDFALEASLSPLGIAWLVFSNFVLVLVTLGLFTPWAHVRTARYVAAHMAINGPRSVEGFIDNAARSESAIGEEVAGFFDFDFSL